MRRFLLSVTTLGVLLLGTGSIVSSCSHQETSGRSAASDEVTIKNFDVNVVNKSAAANYRIALDGDTAYFTMSANVQWLVNVGGYDISALQDSLLGLTFASDKRSSVDASIRSFVADVDLLGTTSGITRIDSIPGDTPLDEKGYEISVEGRLLEVNESFVTYQVTGYSYTGGAHPNHNTFPLTYSLEEKQLLTVDNIFKPGTEESLKRLIRNAAAESYKVPVSQLTSVGFFSDDIPVSRQVCVLGDRVMFHYNAYEIAPYSMGPIDVWFYPSEVEPYLTDLGASVLLGK